MINKLKEIISNADNNDKTIRIRFVSQRQIVFYPSTDKIEYENNLATVYLDNGEICIFDSNKIESISY